ncbi:alanine dehydrogenase [Natronomonas moolapensis 8.8.11]|uniref:Alanine dehydrogenase n=1 Tax=Natronomonas moolapensis (strain DSM 18674 / CECT 7526 / JCM 14361 / 8.8.11) TaxID=268739 RepID=M1XTB5_NATM8|nr:alanine dehydrogenase [Natronomonas moolapensis]CCQ37681.1 alanine dehydrogenase [Natronomonas moolapensis 8.8.11]
METLLLNPTDVDENADMAEVIVAVEEAFAAYEAGRVRMPAKSYIDLPEYDGDFRSMPAYMDSGEWDAAGIKWVNSHTNNADAHGLPTVMGTMIYSDPETAFPLAVMDGTTLTRKRTGAAAAVATDRLAVPDAGSLGIVGLGVQSYTQLEAIATVRDIQTVVVTDKREAAVEAFLERFGDAFDVRPGSVSEAASCDVLSTVTPVESPIVDAADLGEHTHVNAMGADAPGKNELAADVLASAKLVIDDYEQCTHSGEINVPWDDGTLTDGDLHAELGEIVAGKRSGRTPEDGLTVFDSTGLAIQDVAAARVVYERADAGGEGTGFTLVDTELR